VTGKRMQPLEDVGGGEARGAVEDALRDGIEGAGIGRREAAEGDRTLRDPGPVIEQPCRIQQCRARADAQAASASASSR
jgi:hypothetical protein